MTPTSLDPASDPRPDLVADTALWSRLLAASYLLDGNTANIRDSLHWSLQGVRTQGAALETLPDGRIRLVAGEIDPGLWVTWRAKWLWPYSAALNILLRDLAETLGKVEA